MKVYKLLHKPTGLYFTPSKGSGNLSTVGKIYTKKPKLNWVETIRIILKTRGTKLSKKQKVIVDYFNLKPNKIDHYWLDKHFKTNKEDWKIIEL